MKVLYVMPEYTEDMQARHTRSHDIIHNCERVGIEPIVCDSHCFDHYLKSVDLVHVPVSGFFSAFLPMRKIDTVPIVYGPNFPSVQLRNPKEYINIGLIVRFLPEFLVEHLCFRSDYDLLVFQGEFHRNLIESNYDVNGSSFIFPATVDTRLFYPKGHDNSVFTLGYASGDRPGRGLDLFNEAVEEFEDIEVKIASGIPRRDMPDYYNSVDALVFPSVFENSPATVAEALACGTPVIGSDIPPVREIVRNEEDSLLFEPRNVGDLVDKIHALRGEYDRYRKNAESNYLSFDILPELKKLKNKYKELIVK